MLESLLLWCHVWYQSRLAGIKTVLLTGLVAGDTMYVHAVDPLSNLGTNGAEETVLFSEVSSFHELEEWCIYTWGLKTVLFEEVSSFRESPYRMVLPQPLLYIVSVTTESWGVTLLLLFIVCCR